MYVLQNNKQLGIDYVYTYNSYRWLQLNGPVYSLLWSPRKEQLICGRDGYVGVLQTMGKSLAIMWNCWGATNNG